MLHGAHGSDLTIAARKITAEILVLARQKGDSTVNSKDRDLIRGEGNAMGPNVIDFDETATSDVVVLERRDFLVLSCVLIETRNHLDGQRLVQ